MPIMTGNTVINTFSVSSLGSGSTAVTVLVPPCPGPPGSAPYLFNATSLSAGNANWLYKAPLFGVPHITYLSVKAPSTSHSFIVIRPFNWTYFPSGLAVNTTAIPDSTTTGIASDPGLYTTSYGYPCNGTAPGGAANAAISSTNNLVCYQLADGTWQLDTIASGTFGSSLTLTTGTPNRTGGSIPTGGVMFYFGKNDGSLKDPATGLVPTIISTTVSATTAYAEGTSLIGGRWPGDCFLIYDANGTAADSFTVAGYYGQC